MKGQIQSIEITYMLHATEDPEKAAAAVTKLLGFDAIPETESFEGHFGNEIVRARIRLTGDEATGAFRRLAASISDDVKEEITSNVSSFLDEHSAFFLRLDKQRLVSGTLALGSGDAVRVKVKPRSFLVKGGGQQFYLGLLGKRGG